MTVRLCLLISALIINQLVRVDLVKMSIIIRYSAVESPKFRIKWLKNQQLRDLFYVEFSSIERSKLMASKFRHFFVSNELPWIANFTWNKITVFAAEINSKQPRHFVRQNTKYLCVLVNFQFSYWNIFSNIVTKKWNWNQRLQPIDFSSVNFHFEFWIFHA